MKLSYPIALALEKAIEAVLELDPDTRARLRLLHGKNICVNIAAPQVSLVLCVDNARVLILSAEDAQRGFEEADTTLSGRFSDLLSLVNGNDAIYKGLVSVQGDVGLSQQVKKILEHLDPDWQDAMAPYLGDGLTHQIEVTQKRFSQWIKRTGNGLLQNTSEYVQEEIELVAPNTELSSFCDEVDEVRAAFERLTARVQNLEECETPVNRDS